MMYIRQCDADYFPQSDVWDTALTARYDQQADTWSNTITRLGYDRAYQSVFDYLQMHHTSSQTAMNSSTKVLDVGTGSGDLSRAFVESTQFNGELHGVDISRSMLSQARQNLTAAGQERLVLKQADVEKIPYPDSTFDFVMTAHVLEHLDDPQTAVSEMLRVLKPNGKLLIIMTQPGIWGQWIRWKWGIHPITRHQLHALVSTSHTRHPQILPFGQGSWIQWMSSAVLTQKIPLHNSISGEGHNEQ